MKSLWMLAMVGAFSLVSVMDAEAGRRCGGRHHRRGCGNGCYVQQPCYNGGCQVNGGYQNGGTYVDPNAVPAVDAEPAVNQNAPPAEPEPVK
jgi:uncharacterized membrane protein